jgi:hypothetical protein
MLALQRVNDELQDRLEDARRILASEQRLRLSLADERAQLEDEVNVLREQLGAHVRDVHEATGHAQARALPWLTA